MPLEMYDRPFREHACIVCHKLFECEPCLNALLTNTGHIYSVEINRLFQDRDSDKLDLHFTCPKCKK
jgi:hypothetical protein